MDIDLSSRNISELYFDKDAITDEEAFATAAVESLSVSRNQIKEIKGLNMAFSNLTKLDLSHNVLGAGTTSVTACSTMAQFEPTDVHRRVYYCEGVAPWIAALPATLVFLDVSHNHLSSFVCCSCISHDGALPSAAMTASTSSDLYIRYLRHACPLTLSLFFNHSRFPKLRHLNVSHNVLEVSVAESDTMEDIWQSILPTVLKIGTDDNYICAVENLDISFNAKLASVNCFLFSSYTSENDSVLPLPSSSPFLLNTLNLRGCGVTDLVGLSGVHPFAPCLQRLELDGSPIKQTILGSNHAVMGNIIVSLLLSASMGPAFHRYGHESEGTSKGSSCQNVALCKAVQDLIQNNSNLFTESLQAHVAFSISREHTVDLGSCVYASVLLEVIPSLKLLDGYLHVVECKEAIINATQSTLEILSSARDSQPSAFTSQPTKALAKQMVAPDVDETRLGEGLHRIASKVIPQLHTRVLISELAPLQSGENTTLLPRQAQETLMGREHRVNIEQGGAMVGEPGSFTSLHHDDSDGGAYEALCKRSQELKRELLESQKRCRSYTEHSKELQSQLVADRKHITDQHKEILQLRAERDLTQASLLALKKRLKKRRRELAYGVQAIESQFSTMREREAMSRIQQREKALEKRERRLEKHIALAGASPVRGNTRPLHENRRQVRSVVLREAAIKRKLHKQKSEDPLAFSTSRFHIDNGGTGGRYASQELIAAAGESDMEEDGSRHYLRSYPQQKNKETEKAARRYCCSISPDQRRQLCEAICLADPSKAAPSLDRKTEGGELSPGFASITAASRVVNEDAVDFRSLAEQDLSTLSLTELFEAAAAIRHRQLAQQQTGAQAFKEDDTLHPAIHTASFEASTLVSAPGPALVACSKKRDSLSKIIDQVHSVSDHRHTASVDRATSHILNGKQGDSAFLSALEHIEVPSSISLAVDDDIESGPVDTFDSLNVFEGDESIESHHPPIKFNNSNGVPSDLVSVNRALF
ncbi:unnamed protein product [Phytomonas sp. EM1]|nr:unnamed protein product [Phytomonas sp. EM1]|eukprot:CCW62693.1 unnamed protein product [Phytomonas sp. isolate EM1]